MLSRGTLVRVVLGTLVPITGVARVTVARECAHRILAGGVGGACMGAGGTLVDIRNGACDAIAGIALIADAFETAIRVNALQNQHGNFSGVRRSLFEYLGIIMTVIGALVTLVNIGNDRCLIIIVVSVVITTLVVSASLIILVLIFVSVLLPICNLLIVWSILLLVWLVWLKVVVVIILELLFLRLLWLELRAR